MSKEAMKLALEALLHCKDAIVERGLNGSPEFAERWGLTLPLDRSEQAITALRKALANEALERMAENARELGLDYETHKVEQPYDWSEWVCPDPKGYLMKCCDCGLVHEAEFGVVRYKSETEREDCDMVDDPNLQAVFRMRRSEQWSSVDTAHRAGGLPMEQPAQQEQGDSNCQDADGCPTEMAVLQRFWRGEPIPAEHYPVWFKPAQQEPVGKIVDCDFVGNSIARFERHLPFGTLLYTSPPAQRKPLTDEEIRNIWSNGDCFEEIAFARAIEAAHGIKENT